MTILNQDLFQDSRPFHELSIDDKVEQLVVFSTQMNKVDGTSYKRDNMRTIVLGVQPYLNEEGQKKYDLDKTEHINVRQATNIRIRTFYTQKKITQSHLLFAFCSVGFASPEDRRRIRQSLQVELPRQAHDAGGPRP
jgi:hypothetical protein